MRILPVCILGLLTLATALPAQRNGGPIRPGPWQSAAKVPAGWIVHNTKNYHVQSECGLEKAKRLGEHMEVMNDVYRKMFKPDKAGAKQQTIKLFEDRDAFHRYGAPGGAAAYYSSGDREMVCYDTGKWADEAKATAPLTGDTTEAAADRLARRMKRFEDMMKMDLLGCAAHEGWHQYFHWYVGSMVSLPSWINEGMGDYFYSAAPREKDGKRGSVTLGNSNDARLPIIKAAHRQDRMEPLTKFLGMLQQDYYANPSICYAQGWALCQFLLHYENGKYAKVIPTYIRTVKDDTNVETVTGKAFKGLDLAVMEAEFKAWIAQLPTGPDPEAEAAGEAEGQPPAKPAPGSAEPGGGEPGGAGGSGTGPGGTGTGTGGGNGNGNGGE